MAFVIFVANSLLRDMDMHKITKYMQCSHNFGGRNAMLFFHTWTPFVLKTPFPLRSWSLFHNLFGNFLVNLEIKLNSKFKLYSFSGKDLPQSSFASGSREVDARVRL